MRKRPVAAIAIFLILLTCLSSCGNGQISQDDLGKINDIKIEAPAEEESSVFEEQDCPFKGYSMRELNFYTAMMSLKIPSTWSAVAVNPSQIKIRVPADDPQFPGNTFYIQCVYDYSVEDDGLSPDKSDINRLYKPFSCYMEGLKYSVGGSREGSLRRWRGGWDEIRPPSFVGEADLATTGILGNEFLYNKKTSSVVASGVGLVATFFKWQNFPVMISTFTDEDALEDSALMTEYIMSTAKFKGQKIKSSEEKTFEKNVTASLPSEFKPSEFKENVYHSSFTDPQATSGIGIGIYEVTADYADKKHDAADIIATVGEQVATDLMDPTCVGLYKARLNAANEAKENLVGEERAIFASCLFATDEGAEVAASRTYGTATTQYMDVFIVRKGGDKVFLVATLYSQQQSELAYAIERQAINTLKTKN